MARTTQAALTKVPEVTLVIWIIKVAATTLGETGGDAISMTEHLGYAIGSAIFIGIFVVAGAAQITAKSFHPFLYWAAALVKWVDAVKSRAEKPPVFDPLAKLGLYRI
jgi:uncharacterized membrane-anchored protein